MILTTSRSSATTSAPARLAIGHLVACGRTRIAHITGDPGYGASRERAQGASAALAEAGLPLIGEVFYGAWSEGWGRAAAAMLLERHPETDAVFCGSDWSREASSTRSATAAGTSRVTSR
jgi:DNA-binding LacI/PurR family transcriptional regulator